MQPEEGRNRVIIEAVTPEIDGGRFPIKRIVGEETVVEADILTDGHDALSCALLYRKESEAEWTEVPMEPLGNDRWHASFRVQETGTLLLYSARLGGSLQDLVARPCQARRGRARRIG